MKAFLLLSATLTARALNNGLGATPAMGYSTCVLQLQHRIFSATDVSAYFLLPRAFRRWNDCSSMRDNGPDGWCYNTEAHVKNTTLYMKSSGLFALG
jgi:hypothetical protein